ncbi:hypothetical protein BGZ70_010505 [Mortierella alpina]|uniref:Uncharacterized protein n=1 Tax=Mortierella alpina TaxID=64518 RepID=A0A9P6J110_MORAP|nr:hypothetical protein BGZ70_010505 [Mortierella alpina]
MDECISFASASSRVILAGWIGFSTCLEALGIRDAVEAAEADWILLERLKMDMTVDLVGCFEVWQPSQQQQQTTKQLLTITIHSNTPKNPTNASTMSLFKRSNKNKTASATSSAASTPAQTPRTSMQEQRPAQATQMTREQALEKIMKKSYGGALTGPFIQ